MLSKITSPMNHPYARNFLIFFALVAICSVVLGGLFLKGSKEIKRSDDWVTHSYNVISETRDLGRLVEAMLVDQYEFILGKDNDILTRYDLHKGEFSDKIAHLSDMLSDNQAQLSRISEIRDKYSDFTTYLEEDSAARMSGQRRDSKESMLITTGLKREITRSSQIIIHEESELLNARLEKIEHTKDFYFSAMVVGGISSFLLLVALNGFLMHAQSARNILTRNLEEVEERLKLALRGSSDGIFDWDMRNDDIFWSTEYKSMLGYEENELVASRAIFNSLVHDEDQKVFWDSYNAYIAGKKKEFAAVFRMRHKSGRWIWINSRGKALFDQNGNPTRFIGAHTNISHLKENEIKLQETIDRAEKASKAKSDFLAHMSHEIRTPLTAISGIAEIFDRNKDNLNAKQQQLVSTLNTSTFTLRELINDILDFSKIEGGDLELEDKAFTLSDLFKQVKTIMSVKANESGLRFDFEYKNIARMKFLGDEKRLRQILINLIGNAIKFTHAGEVNVKAYVVHDDYGHNRLVIDVKDTGIGIDADKLLIVFEHFKQGDTSVSRKYGGSGLGLPISQSLARLMGGDITVESIAGQGSVFSLQIPLRLSDEDKRVKGATPPAARIDDKIKIRINASTRILMAEDYEGNIVMLSYILDELGCAYDIAKTGTEAVALWEDNRYNLILMDIQMPEMDGFTATALIREKEKSGGYSRTPIVGMTAHALVGDKDKCIEAGMDAYLPKPIVEADLKAKIYQYLG